MTTIKCARCPNAARPGRRLCAACNESATARTRKMRSRRRENDRCAYCGAPSVFRRCLDCLATKRASPIGRCTRTGCRAPLSASLECAAHGLLVLEPVESDHSTYAIVGVGAGLVKFGRAQDVLARGRDLQCGSPVELLLVAVSTLDFERSLHRACAQFHAHGEWFVHQDVAALIRANMEPRSHSFLRRKRPP